MKPLWSKEFLQRVLSSVEIGRKASELFTKERIFWLMMHDPE